MNADQAVKATFEAPPDTKIKQAKIDQAKHSATFKFTAKGSSATGFQCQLKRKGHKAKGFKKCSSPKTYKDLEPSEYTFQVRAKGPGGKDPSPAKKKFKIK